MKNYQLKFILSSTYRKQRFKKAREILKLLKLSYADIDIKIKHLKNFYSGRILVINAS